MDPFLPLSDSSSHSSLPHSSLPPDAQNLFVHYLFPPQPPEPPAPKASSLQRAWKLLSRPLHSYYKWSGKRQAKTYLDRYSQRFIKEDGSIDWRAGKELERLLNDKLLEKESHYVEEGIKYLKIYAGTAVIVIGVVVGGSVITSAVSSGGALTLPATGTAVFVAVLTSAIGATLTASLLAYRIDAVRKHYLKGVCESQVAHYLRQQETQQKQQLAELIASQSIDLAIGAHTDELPERWRIHPRKRKELMAVLVGAMLKNECHTHFLERWGEQLHQELKQASLSGVREMDEARTEAVARAKEKIWEETSHIEKEEREQLQAEVAREVDYQVAKLWLAPQILQPPALEFSHLIAPFLSRSKHKPYYLHCQSSKAIQQLKCALNGIDRPLPDALARLEAHDHHCRQLVRATDISYHQLEARVIELEEMVAKLSAMGREVAR